MNECPAFSIINGSHFYLWHFLIDISMQSMEKKELLLLVEFIRVSYTHTISSSEFFLPYTMNNILYGSRCL